MKFNPENKSVQDMKPNKNEWVEKYRDPKKALDIYEMLLQDKITPEEFETEFALLTATDAEILNSAEPLLEHRTESYTKFLEEKLSNLEQKLPKNSWGKDLFKKACRSAWFVTKWGVITGVVGGIYTGADLDRQEGFAYKEKAKVELEKDGITSDQRFSAYKPGISEMLYEGITPRTYQNEIDERGFMGNFFKYLKDEYDLSSLGVLQQFVPNLKYSREERMNTANEIYDRASLSGSEEENNIVGDLSKKKVMEKFHLNNWQEYKQLPEGHPAHSYYVDVLEELFNEKIENSSHAKELREKADLPVEGDVLAVALAQNHKLDDAWRIYLGMEQEHSTFGISDYQPSKSSTDMYYFKSNDYWSRFITSPMNPGAKSMPSIEAIAAAEILLSAESGLSGKIQFIKKYGGLDQKTALSNVELANHTVGLGQDEKGSYVYYYDKWDFAGGLANNILVKGVGKPFEIYDRLYYDPMTFEPID